MVYDASLIHPTQATRAAASMQLDEGDSIVKDIGQQFGLDEATIASDGALPLS